MKKNPAVKSMLTLTVSLLLLIGMWSVIGLLVFPQVPRGEKLKNIIDEREALLIQLAEEADNPEALTVMSNSPEVKSLMKEAGIALVFPDDAGVVFALSGKGVPENGGLYLLYRPDGEYIFSKEGQWQPGQPKEGGALEWISADGLQSVTVTRLNDRFYLEESRPVR